MKGIIHSYRVPYSSWVDLCLCLFVEILILFFLSLLSMHCLAGFSNETLEKNTIKLNECIQLAACFFFPSGRVDLECLQYLNVVLRPAMTTGIHRWQQRQRSVASISSTVDRRNPAPVDVVDIHLFTGFYTSQVMQDFFHQR